MIHAHPNEATSLLTSANIIHTNGGGPSVQQHVPSSNSSRLLHSNDIFPSFSFSRISSDYWERYLAAVETHPLVTKSVTASIILGSADLTAQFVEKLQQQGGLEPDAIAESVVVDWLRTLRFAAIGLIGAPWSHFYFYWLDRSLPPSVDPWTTTTAVKVIIDQFVQAPILLAILISSLSFMKRFHWSDVNRDVHDNFIFTLIANWKLWIPASIVNIAFVPPSLRVLFVNIVFFFWTIILSVMLNKSKATSLVSRK